MTDKKFKILKIINRSVLSVFILLGIFIWKILGEDFIWVPAVTASVGLAILFITGYFVNLPRE